MPGPVLILIALALPFVLAGLMPALGRRLGARTAWAAMPAPVFAALVFGWAAASGVTPDVVVPWVPAMEIHLALRLDGLALFFGLVVAVVGIFVVFYAAFYLGDKYRGHGRFYAFLLLFMGAMLGTVLSGNLMQMYVFWELTGLASFLLIGFEHEKKASAMGARMALLTTAFTGLFLLVGFVLLGQAYGTLELSAILSSEPLPGREYLLPWAFGLCVVGIAGKSAQFPFFFWLPNAMAAPTPVSAYLHAATMVKLGVFLTARLMPVFNGLEAWTPTLTILGFGTMLLGAGLAVVANDLKAILAYSTVSQLGLLIGLYGLFPAGTPVQWDYLQILNHVFYKGCLFMVAGIVDHSTGTRDLRQLGGLARRMPWTAGAALIGVAAMAGIPLTTGFLGKELLLASALEFWRTDIAVADWVLATVILASILKVVFSVRIFHVAFMGPASDQVKKHWHAPSWGMQMPPVVLAAAALGFGIAAGYFGTLTGLFLVADQHIDELPILTLWHGWTIELGLSAGIVLAGWLLYLATRKYGGTWLTVPRWLDWGPAFDRLVDALPQVGAWSIRLTQGAKPRRYVPIVIATAIVLWGSWLALHWVELLGWRTMWAPLPEVHYGYHRYFVLLVCAGALIILIGSRNWILQLLALSGIGFLISLYFVLYKAPDLALTQLLVEAALLLLVLMFAMRVRRSGINVRYTIARRSDRVAAATLGISAAVIVPILLLLFQGGGNQVGTRLLERSAPDAGGTNVVNTTLVDFRGLDTFFEILVLAIATLGCLGLLMRRRADAPPRPVRHVAGGPGDVTPVGDSFILSTVVTFIFFLINVFAVYLFFRGHDLPGGGFIAGLCTALSFVMLGFVQGVERLHRFLRIDPMRLAATGLLLALAAGVFAFFTGDAYLRHFNFKWYDVPVLGDVHLGTALLFDLGVYFVVVGVMLKIIFPLAKSVEGFRAFVLEDERVYAAADEEPVEPDARTLNPPGERESV